MASIVIPANESVDFLRDGLLCSFVIPAKAGIQGRNVSIVVSQWRWTPAFAGATAFHSSCTTISQAGIQSDNAAHWGPAFAGTTAPCGPHCA